MVCSLAISILIIEVLIIGIQSMLVSVCVLFMNLFGVFLLNWEIKCCSCFDYEVATQLVYDYNYCELMMADAYQSRCEILDLF